MDKVTLISHGTTAPAESLERRAVQLTAQSEPSVAQKAAITIAPLKIGIVLDRSFSMQTFQSTTLKAVNSLLAEQEQLGAIATTLSLLLFNQNCEMLVNGQLLATVPNLTPAEYQPGGDTALWDGIGTMIDQLDAKANSAAILPRVLVAIITDGEENASSRYSLPQVREMITCRQKAYGWSFILIAPKAATLAFKLGIPIPNARNWQSDPAVITGLLARVSKTISAYQLGDKKAILRLSA